MICLMPKSSQSFFVYCIQSRKKFLTEKDFIKEKGKWGIEQNIKGRLFKCSHHGNPEGPHNINEKAQ